MVGAEDLKLVFYITPSIKKEDVDRCIDDLTGDIKEKLGEGLNIGVSIIDRTTDKEVDYREINAPKEKEEAKKREAHDADADKESARDERTRMEKLGDTLLKIINRDTSDLDPKSKKQVQYMELSSEIFKKIGTTGFHILQQSFGLFQDIYNYMKRSSPLLQSIDQMIQLAVQLFFMPLGNMLGEILLPATLDMLDAVMSIWSGLEGKTFAEAFAYAMSEGIQIAATYLDSIGVELEKQGGFIGGIGVALQTFAGFARQDLTKLINLFLGFARNFVEHWDLWVSIFAGAMATHFANQAATILTIAIGSSALGKLGAAIVTAAPYAVGAATAGGVYGYIHEAAEGGVYGYIHEAAEGGYVPSRPGGKLIRVAEGGEGEYIIPESKLRTMASGDIYSLDTTTSHNSSSSNTYNITINGMTDDELKRYIKDIISDEISDSRLRSGF